MKPSDLIFVAAALALGVGAWWAWDKIGGAAPKKAAAVPQYKPPSIADLIDLSPNASWAGIDATTMGLRPLYEPFKGL